MDHSMFAAMIAVCVIFGLYRRAARSIGPQELAKGKLVRRAVFMAVIGFFFLSQSVSQPLTLAFDAVGIVIGASLACYAIKTTMFAFRNGLLFYCANPWIGVALVLLFVIRIAYRIYEVYPRMADYVEGQSAPHMQLAAYSHDPLTSIILFTLITYSVVYYGFLLRKKTE